MVTKRQMRILAMILEHGPIHVQEIITKIGSANHLTEDLALLKSQLLVKVKVVGNRHDYIITERGTQILRESKMSDVAEDLGDLHRILSGRLKVEGNYRWELREDGTVQKLSIRNRDGTWWVKDQRTEEEKKKDRN